MISRTVDSNVELRGMGRHEQRRMPSAEESAERAFLETDPKTEEVDALEQGLASADDSLPEKGWMRLSSWSQSRAKHVFDCACVLLALPLLIPVLLALGLAVRLTSRGPVLFVQRRIGRHGKAFTILKFRTMIHVPDKAHHAVTTAVNQQFTPIGPFLRRWKLDELPQVLNVLSGHMSLVGPRPKLPEHVVADLPCRPGITGAATIAFAREEAALARLPQHELDVYYHAVVLPAKRHLDAAYMSRATLLSDLKLLVNTVLRRWDDSILENLFDPENLRSYDAMRRPRVAVAPVHGAQLPKPGSAGRSAPAGEAAAL